MSKMVTKTFELSQFAFEVLHKGGMGENTDGAERVGFVVSLYLGDRELGRPAWPYPGFLRGTEASIDVEIEAEIDADLWRAFEEEALRQGVTVHQLSEHAAIYFAAELEAGRVTERILNDLESAEAKGRSH